jgi:hypothetical protein
MRRATVPVREHAERWDYFGGAIIQMAARPCKGIRRQRWSRNTNIAAETFSCLEGCLVSGRLEALATAGITSTMQLLTSGARRTRYDSNPQEPVLSDPVALRHVSSGRQVFARKSVKTCLRRTAAVQLQSFRSITVQQRHFAQGATHLRAVYAFGTRFAYR